MTIGLFGLFFNSDNLGCSALACSVLNLLEGISEETGQPFEYIIFEPGGSEQKICEFAHEMHLYPEQLEVSVCAWVNDWHMLGRWSDHTRMVTNIRRCDLILDATGGDSFSDIYGKKRFYFWSKTKRFIEKAGIPLALLPQTYGPFENRKCLRLAKEIIEDASLVISRDYLSSDFLQTLDLVPCKETTDLAFTMPLVPTSLPKTDKKRIGVNISALLYLEHTDSKISKKNFTCDYKSYIHRLLEYLTSAENLEVYLISHVKDDYIAAAKAAECFPSCHCPEFNHDPLKTKGLIAEMDLLIASRMHATIAAFSTGIPVIPVAYSRKFRGLFETLGYSACIELWNVSLEAAYRQTICFIQNTALLCAMLENCKQELSIRTSENEKLLRNLILRITGKEVVDAGKKGR